MKVLFLSLIFSLPIFAGDLSVICFENNDPGQYVYISDVFMDEDSITFSFDHENEAYLFQVERDELFKNYRYSIEITHLVNQKKRRVYQNVKEYDAWVKVSDNLTCATMD